MDLTINWAAVIVAAVVCFILGWTWYSPLLFGNVWMKEMGMKKPDTMSKAMKSQMMRSMIITVIFLVVTVYILAHFLGYMGVSGLSRVAQLAFWLWLGFMLPLQLNGYLWEKKSLTMVAITAGHDLVTLIVAGWILTSWPM